jgi:hypothetical protein
LTSADELEKQKQAFYEPMGRCIAAWANVEVVLMFVFQRTVGGDIRIADSLLATPRNFEVRSSMIHNAMRIALGNKVLLDDWNLVFNYMTSLASKRNEIAHSTLIQEDDKRVVLRPYFTILGERRDALTVEIISQRARDFEELAGCVGWFIRHLPHTPPLPPQVPPAPEPDLLLRLRKQDAQRREEQRERAKSCHP